MRERRKDTTKERGRIIEVTLATLLESGVQREGEVKIEQEEA